MTGVQRNRSVGSRQRETKCWQKIDDREWKECVAAVNDAEQSLFLFPVPLDTTQLKVTDAVLIAGLHEVVVEFHEAESADGKDLVKVIFRTSDSKTPKHERQERYLRLSFRDRKECRDWAAWLKRCSFPPAKLWSSKDQNLRRYAISKLSCEKIGAVWKTDGAQTKILIDSLRLCSVNSLLKEDTNLNESALLLLRLKIFGCTLSMDRVRSTCSEQVVNEVEGLKINALREILEFLSQKASTGGQLDEIAYCDLIEMVSVAVLRPLHIFTEGQEVTLEVEQAQSAKDAPISLQNPISWDQLSLSYEILLKLIGSNLCDVEAKKRCIPDNFCKNVLQLFRSPDAREREYVKTVTHCLYSRFIAYRGPMRAAMANFFLESVYSCKHRRGVAELLEVFGSIASGFATPLKEEHKTMLTKCLLPLHSVRGSEHYMEQLSFVLVQYVTKDTNLVVPVVRSMLRYWPKRSAAKQILFLAEIGEFIGFMEPTHFYEVQSRLVRQIAECISGPHFQVSEYAMGLLNNSYLYSMLFDDEVSRRNAMPRLLRALRVASEGWNHSVKQIGTDIIEFFRNLDRHLFLECEKRFEERAANEVSILSMYETLETLHGNELALHYHNNQLDDQNADMVELKQSQEPYPLNDSPCESGPEVSVEENVDQEGREDEASVGEESNKRKILAQTPSPPTGLSITTEFVENELRDLGNHFESMAQKPEENDQDEREAEENNHSPLKRSPSKRSPKAIIPGMPVLPTSPSCRIRSPLKTKTLSARNQDDPTSIDSGECKSSSNE